MKKVRELAFDPGQRGSIVDPSKKDWIETGDEKINALFPELGNEEQSYLEMVTSKSYQDLVAKIENYTGLTVGRGSLPSLMMLLFQALGKVKGIEAAHTRELEELALRMVFTLDEFQVVEDSYLNNRVKFDIKLGKAELENLIGPEKEEESEELTGDETANMELAQLWDNLNDTALRRKFANLMISGGATSKLYLFHMADEELSAIDPDLVNLYGILASVAQIGYWVTPMGLEAMAAQGGDTAAGSEEVIPEGDIYVIKARGTTFPFLVHEIVKGIYEWLSLNADIRGELGKDQLEDETKDIMAGPELFKNISGMLSQSQQHLMPLIQKMMINLKAEEIKSILSNSLAGKKLMKELINQAESSWGDYQRSKI